MPCLGTEEAGGLAFRHGADKLAEVRGRGVVVADVGFGQIAVLGLGGGDVEGYMEIGTGVGGGFALADAGESGQLCFDCLAETSDTGFVGQQVGTDEHQGKEVALHGAFGEHGVAMGDDIVQRLLVLVCRDGCLLAVDPATKDFQ